MEHHDQKGISLHASQTLQPFPNENSYGYESIQYRSLTDYWHILVKRKWWIFGCWGLVMLLVGLYTFLKTPIYRSTITVQIIQDNPGSVVAERDPLAAIASGETLSRFYETQYKLLGSFPLAQKIVGALNLGENPRFKKLQEGEPKLSPQEIDAAIAQSLVANLEIVPIKNSYLVEISFNSPDKNLAMQVPNAAYREYLKFSMETRSHSYSLVKEWLQEELQKLAHKVETSEQNLYQHGKKEEFLSLEGEDNVVVKKFVELNRVLTAAQSERAGKEAQYRQLVEKGVDAPMVTNNHLILRLREEFIQQEAKLGSLRTVFAKNHPQYQAEEKKLKGLQSRLNGEVQRVLKSVKADYEVTKRAENLLQEEIGYQKNKVISLQDHLVRHHILKRDMQTNQQLFDALLVRMKEASVASTMVASNAALIQPADLPKYPFKPNKAKNLTLAMLIGLIGGIGLAFLVEHLDNSIKSTEEMERICQIPSLGVVPLFNPNRRQIETDGDGQVEMLTFEQPKSMLGESISHVRTSLMLSTSGGPPRTLLVASPNPQEGKTTLSLNLAMAMAMDKSHKVLIIDCDLRKPRVHQVFHESHQPGLSNFLTGSATLAEVIRPAPIPNLFFIPAGPTPPNPVQLLISQAFKDMVEELRRDFNHIVFDVPPIIGFADGRVISQIADGTVLVLRNHHTSRDAAKLAINLLNQAQANILGVVLNMAHKGKIGYGGYYEYYKYYSRYYKGYYAEP